jgi:F-type H+-transporting ATPase subunit delta
MPLSGSAARRFAEALLDLAGEKHATAEWGASLDRLVSALSGESLRLLASPAVPFAVRRDALERATEAQPAGVRALLTTLLERDLIALLPAVSRAYQDLVDARAGIEKAVITTAVPLEEGEREALVQRLERASGRRLRATFAVEPAIVGGMLVRIGDHQVDGSVRTRLALLGERLAAG